MCRVFLLHREQEYRVRYYMCVCVFVKYLFNTFFISMVSSIYSFAEFNYIIECMLLKEMSGTLLFKSKWDLFFKCLFVLSIFNILNQAFNMTFIRCFMRMHCFILSKSPVLCKALVSKYAATFHSLDFFSISSLGTHVEGESSLKSAIDHNQFIAPRVQLHILRCIMGQ